LKEEGAGVGVDGGGTGSDGGSVGGGESLEGELFVGSVDVLVNEFLIFSGMEAIVLMGVVMTDMGEI
jgi:hypothetical protein